MDNLYHIAHNFGNVLFKYGLTVATAESCTGGGVAYALTEIPGSSTWFIEGWVTYSNRSKHELLGVPMELIEKHGAVSESVARAMAEGALLRSHTSSSLAITGIAGPGGGTPDKPVGTIWLAFATAKGIESECLHLSGDRASIRQQTISYAIQKWERILTPSP